MSSTPQQQALVEVSTAAQLAALTRQLASQRRWPQPTKFRGAPWLDAFGDGSARALQQRCGQSESLRGLRVEAQVNETQGDYHGDEERRRDVAVKLASMLSLMEANGDATHWLREATDGAEYYLAQAPLWSVTSDGTETRGALAELVLTQHPAKALPPWLRGAATLNLWLSPGATSSAPHCDESHNVLTVLAGRKTVLLLPPACGASLGAFPAWSESPHHCRASSAAAARHPRAETVVLDRDEALLIPAGWYHAVASRPGTVAANCWWPPHLPCRRQEAIAALAFRRRGPRLAFLARRALIRRQRRAITTALGGGALRYFADGGLDALLRAAAADPARWRRKLAAAPPAACAALYILWTREADGACEPLLGVFAPGERGAALARLRRGRDVFARAVFGTLRRRLLRRLSLW